MSRRSARHRNWTYRARGAYFVTICTHDRRCVLGRVVDGRAVLSEAGRMVHEAWHDLARRYPFVRLDEFVVMPNHIHGILWLVTPSEVEHAPRSLSDIVCRFKTGTTYQHGGKLWQRSYHDRAIRNDRELEAIREYIRQNPARWAEDTFHVEGA